MVDTQTRTKVESVSMKSKQHKQVRLAPLLISVSLFLFSLFLAEVSFGKVAAYTRLLDLLCH